MERMFYLLNIEISGIKSIRDKIRLEFYKKTVNKDFNPEKYRIKAIYGENGSGKSAIITAMKILKDIVMNERYLSDSENQNFLNEIINKETRIFHIDCEFLIDIAESKEIYNYCIEIGLNEDGIFEIQKETLKVKSASYANSNYKKIYETKDGELLYVKCENENNRNTIQKKSLNLLTIKSFISLCIGSKREEMLLEPEFGLNILVVAVFAAFLKIYIAEEDQHELYFLRKKIKSNNYGDGLIEAEFKEIEKHLDAFSGVNEKRVVKKGFTHYKQRVKRLESFLKLFKNNLVSIDIDTKENGEFFECDLNLNYGTYNVNKEFESTGIKKLIRLFDCFTAVSKGGIVFIDEMDSNLNDVYLCKIIEYFMYYATGQLCFTTHNLDPMTVLKENKYSIDFLSSDNHLVSWVSHGNASPENYYKNGMIEDSPFNIDATDFIGIFGD